LHFAFQRIDNSGSASPAAAAFRAAPIAVLLMTLLCAPAGGAGGVPCVSNGLIGAVLWPSAKAAAGGSSAIMVEQQQQQRQQQQEQQDETTSSTSADVDGVRPDGI
jgi:hypothetical protein